MVPPNFSISCLGLQPRLKSLRGWQVTWDAKPHPKSPYTQIFCTLLSAPRGCHAKARCPGCQDPKCCSLPLSNPLMATGTAGNH